MSCPLRAGKDLEVGQYSSRERKGHEGKSWDYQEEASGEREGLSQGVGGNKNCSQGKSRV